MTCRNKKFLNWNFRENSVFLEEPPEYRGQNIWSVLSQFDWTNETLRKSYQDFITRGEVHPRCDFSNRVYMVCFISTFSHLCYLVSAIIHGKQCKDGVYDFFS